MNRREFIAATVAVVAVPSLPAELKPGDTITIASRMVENPATSEFKPETLWAGDLLRIEHHGIFTNHRVMYNVQESCFIDMEVGIHPAIWSPREPGENWGQLCNRIPFSTAVKAYHDFAAEMKRLGVTPARLAREMYPENW